MMAEMVERRNTAAMVRDFAISAAMMIALAMLPDASRWLIATLAGAGGVFMRSAIGELWKGHKPRPPHVTGDLGLWVR